jgi:hypothetical protein
MNPNTKKLGQKKELLCANELKKRGWFIAFRSTTVKRGPFWVGLDFGDCVDVVALTRRTEHCASVWKFVSCTFASHRSEKIAALTEFALEFGGICGHEFEVWVWHKGKWSGRGSNKHFEPAHWEVVVL